MGARPRWPWGLLGALALVVAVELLAARGERFLGDKGASWTFAARLATGNGRGAKVVILGDSMVKFGLLPEVFEASEGRSALNLALFDGPPLASLALLDRLIAAGRAPEAFVINVMPHQLQRPVLDVKHRGVWGRLLGPLDAWRYGAEFGAWGLVPEVLLGRVLPTLSVRDEIRATIEAALGGKERSAAAVVRLYRRNWEANRGAHVLAARSEPGQFARNNHELFPTEWRVDEDQRRVVEALLARAEGCGARVYWLISPLHPEAQEELDRRGIGESYAGVVEELRGRHPAMVVLDGRRLGIEATDFADAVHLDREGALLLSEAVAGAIKREVGDGSWVELRPAARAEGRAAVALEDIAESQRALRDRRRATR